MSKMSNLCSSLTFQNCSALGAGSDCRSGAHRIRAGMRKMHFNKTSACPQMIFGGVWWEARVFVCALFCLELY
jgi:hypothetical protein